MVGGGATRSRERGEFSIAGVMDRQDEIVQLPKSYQVADQASGEMVFQTNCGGRHPGAAGDALALARQRHPDPAGLATVLGGSAGVAMRFFWLQKAKRKRLWSSWLWSSASL